MKHLLIAALSAATIASSVVTLAAAEVKERTANNGNVLLSGIPEIPSEIGRRLARYQNVRGASFRGWTRDGASIYISTRFGEVSQLHRVDMPLGARNQLTFFKEPIGQASRRPKGTSIAMTMDQGGNEFAQIFLLNPKNGNANRLSDGESRNGGIVWSDDGKLMAFRSTRRNGRSNDVWIMSPERPESAELVLASPDGSSWGVVDFSPDGRKLLIAQYVSVTDSRIYLLDLNSKERSLLLGDVNAPSVNLPSGFAADGRGFYFTADSDANFRRLAYYEIDSGKVTILTEGIDWDVSGLLMSEDRTRGAFSVNAGGRDQVYLFDPSNHKYSSVSDIPVGRAFLGAFSPDNSQLAMTLNTATSPSDIYTLPVGADGMDHGPMTRWTSSEIAGLDASQFVEPSLIYYPTFDSVQDKPRQIPAWVYKPLSEGPHPVIISIHGGPESQFRPGFSSTFQQWIADLGAAVIAPNVRGSAGYGRDYVQLDNGFKREDSVRDIGALLDWIETQSDLDKDRIAVFGGSYGGYMVLASMVHYSDRLAAGVDIVGISNFVTFLENTEDYRRDLRRVEYGDERDPKMRAHLESISPSNQPEKITAPLLVVQGENDPRVPASEARQIVSAVRGTGQDVWFMNALNEGHGFRKKENRDLYAEVVNLFFQEHFEN
jgi:dipeptidyl aminopeptidase/acylaminoacyl peptidase